MAANTRPVHRTGEPIEINLKQFYKLSKEKRKAHILELKKLSFDKLSQTDIGVISLWYENWLIESWPIPKKNFISIG